MSEPTETVEDVYEPYLIQQGLLMRTPGPDRHPGGLRAPRPDPTREPDPACARAVRRLTVHDPPQTLDDIDYELPVESIAQVPLAERPGPAPRRPG
ncbi:MAG: Holliday junction DNA helicase RuvB C-terminal domain-containing protein [Acidimicrobiales bacterium]